MINECLDKKFFCYFILRIYRNILYSIIIFFMYNNMLNYFNKFMCKIFCICCLYSSIYNFFVGFVVGNYIFG